MLQRFAPHWKSLAIRGALAIIFGLIALIWPRQTITILLMILGVYMLIDGAIIAFTGLRMIRERRDWWGQSLQGIVGMIIGGVLLFSPVRSAQVLILGAAAWAIIMGALKLILAIVQRRQINNEWSQGAGGVLLILLGIFLLILPGGLVAFLWVLGVFAIVVGVLMILVAFRLRDMIPPAEESRRMPTQQQ